MSLTELQMQAGACVVDLDDVGLMPALRDELRAAARQYRREHPDAEWNCRNPISRAAVLGGELSDITRLPRRVAVAAINSALQPTLSDYLLGEVVNFHRDHVLQQQPVDNQPIQQAARVPQKRRVYA